MPTQERADIGFFAVDPLWDALFGELAVLGYRDVRLLAGGVDAWQAAGNTLATGDEANSLPDARCIDFLFFVHDRHDGNKEAARRYLAWETNLIGQLDAQELATFRFA